MKEKFLINDNKKIIILKNDNYYFSPSDKKDGVFLGLINFKELNIPISIYENKKQFVNKVNSEHKNILIDYFIKNKSISKISLNNNEKYSKIYKIINKYKFSLIFSNTIKFFNEINILDDGYYWCFYQNKTTIIYIKNKIIYDFHNNSYKPRDFNGIIISKI